MIPSADSGTSFNANSYSLESLAEVPCLVLLGEPGMGKSTALNELRELTLSTKAEGDAVLFFYLGAYQTDGLLVEELFKNAEVLDRVSGTHRLHLYLDGLDECLLQINTVASLLAGKLSQFYNDRLFVRITCRTAEWPPTLDNALKHLWVKRPTKLWKFFPDGKLTLPLLL